MVVMVAMSSTSAACAIVAGRCATMIRVIAGNYQPTAGIYQIDNHEVHFKKPAEARYAGVEVVYQDLALCNNLSSAANVSDRASTPALLTLYAPIRGAEPKLAADATLITPPRPLLRRRGTKVSHP